MARPLHPNPSIQACVRARRVRRCAAWAVVLLAAVACAPLAQRWAGEAPPAPAPAAPEPARAVAQHGPAPGTPVVEVQPLDATVSAPVGPLSPPAVAAAMPRARRPADAVVPAAAAARAEEEAQPGPDLEAMGLPAMDAPPRQGATEAAGAGGNAGGVTAVPTRTAAVPAPPPLRQGGLLPQARGTRSMWAALLAAAAGVLLVALLLRRGRRRSGAGDSTVRTAAVPPPAAAVPSFQPTDDDDVMQPAVQPEPTPRSPHAPDMSLPNTPLQMQSGPVVAADAAVLHLVDGGGSGELVARWWLQDDELDYWHEWCTPVGVVMEMMPPALTALVDGLEADAGDASRASAVVADPHADLHAADAAPPPPLVAAVPGSELQALPVPQPQPQPQDESRPAAALQQLEAACAVSAGVLVLVNDPDLPWPRLEQTMDAPPAAQALALLHDAVQVSGGMGVRNEHNEADAWACSEMLRVQVGHGARDGVKAASTRANAIIDAHIHHAQGPGLDAWRAQRIRLKLAAATRETGVVRLLALRALRADAPEQAPAAGPGVLKAWLDVLWYWSALLRGDAAQPLFAEAVGTCQALQQWPEQNDEAQRLLGHTLARRAVTELGGVRVASLEQAQALHDALHARTGSALSALAVAQTALVRLQAGVAGDTGELCAHALQHAFHAGSDPRTAARALHCRLHLQLAYESLPGVPTQGDVALGLVRSLATAPALPLPTVEHMVAVLLRHGDARAACALCEAVLRAGQDSPALRQAWDTASRRWGQAAQGTDRAAWQANTRQRLLLFR